MAIDIIARGMIESSKSDISQLFDITKGGADVGGESSYTLKNAVDYPLLGLNLYGKSVQDGVPTPENPVEIVSVESPTITVCGKNMYIGSQDWSGEWKNDAFFENVTETYIGLSVKRVKEYWTGLKKSLYVEKGKTYTFSCYAKADVDISCKIFILAPGEQINGTALPIYESKMLNVGTEWARYQVSYTCKKSGYVKPRIEKTVQDGNYLYVCGYQLEESKTMTDYAPYKGSTATITSALPLCGIPVESGGNYTDKDGQQWVCDELIYNADGTGKIVKNTIEMTFDGSEDENLQITPSSAGGKNRLLIALDLISFFDSIKYSVSQKSFVISNRYQTISAEQAWLNQTGIAINHNASGNIIIYDEEYATYTLNEWKAWLANNPITVVYALNTTQEIELTAAEMSALRQVQTFNGITNISNDGGADMDVKICTNKTLSEYVMPITTGLQSQIDELKAAVLSLGGNV